MKRLALLLILLTVTASAERLSISTVLAVPNQVARLLLESHIDQPEPQSLNRAAWRALDPQKPAREWAELYPELEKRVRSITQAQDLVTGVVQSMVASLNDPYTIILSPSERKWEEQVRSSGSFVGIGVELAARNGLTVVSCLDGSPAVEAGLQAGDRILSIDGKAVDPLTFYAAGNLLLGREGSYAKLAIQRNGSTLALQVRRRRLTLPGVEHRMLDQKTGYLRLGYFGPSAAAETRKALDNLRSAGAQQLILDLRNNPGGDFEQGKAVACLFVTGPYLKVEERPDPVKELVAEPHSQHWSQPVAVLVNQGTASAAEIVAQAIKGRRKSVLVGQRTFGKARIQTLYALPGGGAINISTGRYLGIDGEDIHNQGLKPNVVDAKDPLRRALELLY